MAARSRTATTRSGERRRRPWRKRRTRRRSSTASHSQSKRPAGGPTKSWRLALAAPRSSSAARGRDRTKRRLTRRRRRPRRTLISTRSGAAYPRGPGPAWSSASAGKAAAPRSVRADESRRRPTRRKGKPKSIPRAVRAGRGRSAHRRRWGRTASPSSLPSGSRTENRLPLSIASGVSGRRGG